MIAKNIVPDGWQSLRQQCWRMTRFSLECFVRENTCVSYEKFKSNVFPTRSPLPSPHNNGRLELVTQRDAIQWRHRLAPLQQTTPEKLLQDRTRNILQFETCPTRQEENIAKLLRLRGSAGEAGLAKVELG